ncbi:MAG TPA: PfkB family carbohydrate kinase [Chloroflexota bacterium]|nr:PfkB family carbohydrate kinase [Chloroflexota bacterium]
MIVALGDAALDVFVAPDLDAIEGSDVAGAVRVLPGGSAANFAVWVARLGARSALIGTVGDDYAGNFVRTDLAREGVLPHLQKVHAATAAIAVLVDANGERTMITDRGAATLLALGMLEPHMLPPGCHLHIPAYSLFVEPLCSAAVEAASRARSGGGTVAVDTSSVGPLRAFGRERFLRLLDDLTPHVLFANHAEATFLSGADDPAAGSLILQRYAPLILWKLGADGVLARAEEVAREPGLPVAALDSTGAGDAFAAAFTVAHRSGAALAVALARANRLAAAVVRHIGARPRLDLQLEEET